MIEYRSSWDMVIIMKRSLMIFFLVIIAIFLIFPIYFLSVTDDTPAYEYTVVNTYPHDQDAFTQGLVYDGGIIYEGTGLRGRSSIRKVDLETGKILQIHNLSSEYFGEGITIFGDRLIQLTWQAGVGFVYNKNNFELLHEFSYPTEGWGITHDGQHLIMSDGTSTLHFLDPETFDEISRVDVYDKLGPVTRINELEYINGEVYANIWQTDRIARISPITGQVTGWIELGGLLPTDDQDDPDAVLNGIAYDEKNDRLIVTGKLWPNLYEIEFKKVD
jgi:glutamine cyclotransferase